jgi:D-threonate/D-erythronate kinase
MTESVQFQSILALADDLTGALETGARFAAAGLAVRVLDTETRHLAPPRARAHVLGLLRDAAPGLLFKKTDSTLRGNIGAELAALADRFPGRPIHYAPAYPELGRTVRGGALLVDGVPVHLTAFALDPTEPVRESHVPTLLRPWRLPLRIYDGATDGDVAAAAGTALEDRGHPVLAAGPDAFAGALAARLGRPRAIRFPTVRSALVINGSLHPASAAQIAAARASGLPGGWRIATLAEALRTPSAAYVVFGGDTARAVLGPLGSPPLHPLGEVVPGVPVSVTRAGVVFVTKAGGFGRPDLLVRVARLLANRREVHA